MVEMKCGGYRALAMPLMMMWWYRAILVYYCIILHCFCFFLVPVFDRGRYGIYSRTPYDDDDDDDDEEKDTYS